jgi:CobQ-like glutamine amidotransferase family enzyme
MSNVIRVASIYPTLLGTYGDGGNVAALRHIAGLHGLQVHVTEVDPGMNVPADAHIYVLGGGEDTAQTAAAHALRTSGALAHAVANGSSVLAICAGYQLLGHSFPDAAGTQVDGLGLLDVHTDRLPQRAVGELAAEVLDGTPLTGLPTLTGYENHGGAAHLGPLATPLARVVSGVGNGDGTEGAITGRVIGTYLHGPALVRNPQLAERLLGWAADRTLAPIEEPAVIDLRAERLSRVKMST